MNPLEKAWAVLKGTRGASRGFRRGTFADDPERSFMPPQGGDDAVATQIDPTIVRLIMEKLGHTDIDPYDQTTQEAARMLVRPITTPKPPHVMGVSSHSEEDQQTYDKAFPGLSEYHLPRQAHLWDDEGPIPNLDHQAEDVHYEDTRKPRNWEKDEVEGRRTQDYLDQLEGLF